MFSTSVITTINSYKDTFIKDIEAFSSSLIIVGDKKTPHSDYLNRDLVYIHPEDESEFSSFSKLLPYNHYCRKNLGYLKAISLKAESILDTDDDNFPICDEISLILKM